jgi:hypothetical protein
MNNIDQDIVEDMQRWRRICMPIRKLRLQKKEPLPWWPGNLPLWD